MGERHPHLIVMQGNKENISVGLTSSNNRNDLHKVYYSNGKTAFMKRNAERLNKAQYENKIENFKADIDTENRAYKIAMNKLLKDFEK